MKSAVVGIALLLQISGMVIKRGTDAIQPLPNARVELLDGPTQEVMRTDGAGRFLFDGIRPGHYRVFVTHDGFVRQEYGQRIPGGPSSVVTVTEAKGADNLVFLMQPAPTIAGWVRDEFGEVVPGVLVEAFRKGYDTRGRRTITPMAATLSDDRGQYRLYWLDPGDYVVRAGSRTAGAVYLPTYYPGFEDPGAAETISLKDREVDGIDFKLVRGLPVSVQGSVVFAQGGFSGASVILQPPGDVASGIRYTTQASRQRGRAEGTFTIDNVTPGTYIASATETFNGKSYSGYTTIVLPNGKSVPVYHFRILIAPNVALNGTVHRDSEEATDFGRAEIILISLERALPSPTPAKIALDGSFSVANVAAGAYSVSMIGLPEDVYMKDAIDYLEINPGIQPKSLNLILGSHGGAVMGTVHDSSGQPRFGVQVILIPEGERRAQTNQYRIMTSGPDGSFAIRNIPPGDYKIFAWEVIEPNAHLNPDFVKSAESIGRYIHVGSDQHVSLDLPMIPAEP